MPMTLNQFVCYCERSGKTTKENVVLFARKKDRQELEQLLQRAPKTVELRVKNFLHASMIVRTLLDTGLFS